MTLLWLNYVFTLLKQGIGSMSTHYDLIAIGAGSGMTLMSANQEKLPL